MNSILLKDIKEIIQLSQNNLKALENKTIFISGGTGLIGSILVNMIKEYNKNSESKIKLVLLVRNIKRAEEMYGKQDYIEYIESNIEDYEVRDLKLDYIIHMASPTKSKYFINNPVETIETAVSGTQKMLEQAKISNVKSFVYLSSMEVYGTMDDEDVTEDKLGYIDNLSVRSSYSEGKRICELLVYSFYKEYGVPVKIARLAQTFGAGISKEENRVYKMFCDCVLQKNDIVLKTQGTTIVNFCYTTDAIRGIIDILLNGIDGEAYNVVSDNKNKMTIYDIATWLAREYTNDEIAVRIEIDSAAFAPDNKMLLNNKKIKSIGWKPEYTVLDGYDRLIKYLEEENNEN